MWVEGFQACFDDNRTRGALSSAAGRKADRSHILIRDTCAWSTHILSMLVPKPRTRAWTDYQVAGFLEVWRSINTRISEPSCLNTGGHRLPTRLVRAIASSGAPKSCAGLHMLSLRGVDLGLRFWWNCGLKCSTNGTRTEKIAEDVVYR